MDGLEQMNAGRHVRPSESEKLTINIGFVDLGSIDLAVSDGLYSNRSDFIRTAVRNQLEKHRDVLTQSAGRNEFAVGLHDYTRARLEAARRAKEMVHVRVIGLARIAADVDADLARSTIASITVLGALHASDAVKAALRDRIA
ncbi:MAG: CopG family transcriptional regulator [Vulcanimicrobiaceae bacterium]